MSVREKTPRSQPRPESNVAGGIRYRTVILIGIVAVFALALFAKSFASAPGSSPAKEAGAGRLSMVRDDPVAAYDSALEAGKPVYVLFHSLTCQPCVEISATADEVVPEYADRLTFVNAITDDAGGQALASRFSFQYIPTSFFVNAEGDVVDSYTGVLGADEMRTRLDALVAR